MCHVPSSRLRNSIGTPIHRQLPTRVVRLAAQDVGNIPGKCWLVGSGPGDPDLLTLKAVRLLSNASVVVYDDLGASDAVLSLAPPSAQRFYVGKRGGAATSWRQPEINALLVRLCKAEGKEVVRLKGGCPSVFSRVHNELEALRNEGVCCTMVPGVSSALAAPLLAGFPLTDAAADGFAVVTGHDAAVDGWAKGCALAPTLVILMGARMLPTIVQRLVQDYGRAPSTPVCAVRDAGTSEQRVWHADLGSIVSVTAGECLSPCVVVVGHVAAAPHQLS